jgi:TolA-binding protein
MGALVPLLLAMMHTARHQAEATALAKASEQAAQREAELRTNREDVLWRIEQLKHVRTRAQSQLADARLDLGHLEDHSRRLQGELERYRNTIADLENIENADRQKHGESEAELNRLHEQIAAAKQQVDQVRKDAANRPRSYAVVPYEGPNQTRRRPIYLECRADAVVLQPEGIRLTDADFEGPMGPGNPLAVALRAARERMLAEREFDPQAGEPYPMLLVRPDGIGAYYAAREAMKSWGCDFGYELVGDDWKLAYPPPNRQLAEVVFQAIASARINQARLIAAAPRQYASRSKTPYRGSSGGAFANDDESDDDDSGYRPAAPAGAVGGNGGGNGNRGNGGYGNSYGGGGYSGRGTGTTGEYNPYASAASQRPGTAVPGGGVPGVPSDGVSSGGPSLAPAGGNAAVGGGYSNVGGGGYGAGAGGGYGGGGGGTGGGTGAAGGAAGGMGNGNAGGMGGGTPGGMGNGNPGGPSPGGADGPRNPMRSGTGDATAANPYITMPQQPENASPGGSRPGGFQRSNDSQNNGAAVERPDGYVVGQPAREAPSPTSRDPQSSADASRGRVMRPGEWEPTPDPPPKPRDEKKDDDQFGENKHHKPPRSLAERRGEDWGLRDAGKGSIGVTRPIRVECYADRLVVLSERNPADNRVVPLGRRTASSIDPFISAVWGHIEGWGIAGRGMYWRPVLQVSVAPGAEDRFADLSALLDGSGLTVKRR